MKLYYIFLFLTISAIANGQRGPLSEIDDDWYWNIGSKGLKPGDNVSGIPLGVNMDNPNQQVTAMQFKGKLLILDFWNTDCSSCIDAFPKMEKLQKEFGDKIQIVLVNTSETADSVKARLKRKNKLAMLPSLPRVVSEINYNRRSVSKSRVREAFPNRAVPYHVWVGPDGLIKFMGRGENTYAKKIQDYLDGKEVFFMSSSATVPDMGSDNNTAYYQLLGDFKQTYLSTGSFVTKFNNEVKGYEKEIVDSTRRLRINYFINTDLLHIYLRGPYWRFNRYIHANFIYHPSRVGWEDFVIFDSTLDISRFLAGGGRNKTDEDWFKAKYCYELVTPLHVPEEIRKQFMREDLNRFLAIEMGATSRLESRPLKCYALVKTSRDDRVSTEKRNISLISFVKGLINQHPTLKKSLLELIQREQLFILNETGLDNSGYVDIKPPTKELKTLSDLREYLQAWGLDLQEREKAFDYLIFEKIRK